MFPFRTFSSEDSHQSLRPESMATGDLAAGSILLLQTVFGMLGNFSLLYCYLFLYCTGDRLRTVDLIVTNLIVANIFHSVVCWILQSNDRFWVEMSQKWICMQSFCLSSRSGQGSIHWHHMHLECLPGHHDQSQELQVGRS